MNELKVFSNEELGSVRTVVVDGEPFLAGKDVAEILGYNDTAQAVRKHVDEDDKGVVEMTTPRGKQKLVVINESGLYSLILLSKLPTAKKFKKWVTSEVLPAIRKHGVYALDEVLANPDFMIQALEALKAERAARQAAEDVVAIQSQQIAELKPKADYHDVVLNCTDLVSISKISKDYGWTAQQMNRFLHEKGIQYKQGSIWLLYKDYAGKGYTHTKTHTYLGSHGDEHCKVQTYWTQKGRLFIYDLMVAAGYRPLIECK